MERTKKVRRNCDLKLLKNILLQNLNCFSDKADEEIFLVDFDKKIDETKKNEEERYKHLLYYYGQEQLPPACTCVKVNLHNVLRISYP